jgi:hypothetical protein
MSNLSPPLSAVRATTSIRPYPSPAKDLEATILPVPPYRGYAFLETSVLYPLYITSTPPAGIEPHKVFALEPVPGKGVHRIRNVLEDRHREGEWVWSCDKGGFVEWRKGGVKKMTPTTTRQANVTTPKRPPRSTPRRPPPLQLRLNIPEAQQHPGIRRDEDVLLLRLPDNTFARLPFPAAAADSGLFRSLETAYYARNSRSRRRFGFKHLRQIRIGDDVRVPWREKEGVVESIMKLKGTAAAPVEVEFVDGWSWKRLLAAVALVVTVAAAATAVWYNFRGESGGGVIGAFLLGGLVLLVGSGVVAVGVAVSW